MANRDYRLTCLHVVTFRDSPPRTGDYIYCIRCDRESRVLKQVKPERQNA